MELLKSIEGDGRKVGVSMGRLFGIRLGMAGLRRGHRMRLMDVLEVPLEIREALVLGSGRGTLGRDHGY